MRPRLAGHQPAKATPQTSEAPTDAAEIDSLYGLDPIYEPGSDSRQRPLDATAAIECPYCWQTYDASIDLTLGAQSWIEDCQHCCHPIAVNVEVIEDGRSARVNAERSDA